MALHDDSLSADVFKRSTIDTEEFIQRVQERPELWDSRHPLYKNKSAQKKMWEELRKSYFSKSDVDELKRKWKNLKDSFRKEYKKRGEFLLSVQYPGINSESTWVHYASLQFLKEDTIFAASLNALSRGKIQEEAKENSGDDGETRHSESQDKSITLKTCSRPTARASPVPSPQSLTEEPSTGVPAKRPNEIRAEFLEIEKKKLKILEQEIEKQKNEENNQKSEDYHFLMSILPQLEKLHPIQKYRIRNKINQALLEELNVIKVESERPSVDLPQSSDKPQHYIDLPKDTENVYCKVEIEDSFF